MLRERNIQHIDVGNSKSPPDHRSAVAQLVVVTGKIVKLTKRGRVVFLIVQNPSAGPGTDPTEHLVLDANLFESVDEYVAARGIARVGATIEARGMRGFSRSGVPSLLVASLKAVLGEVLQHLAKGACEVPTNLYEDDFLVAVSKPFGVTMQDFAAKLGDFLPLFCLDKDTSGVVVFTRHEHAAKFAHAEHAYNTFLSYEYIALVRGVPMQETWSFNEPLLDRAGDIDELQATSPSQSGQIRSPHSHDPEKGDGRQHFGTPSAERHKARGCESVRDRALVASNLRQIAVMSFWREGLLPTLRASFIRCSIDVFGGTHQIRRYLQSLGHSIVGDKLYGDGQMNKYVKRNLGDVRLFLHASRLCFKHPSTGTAMFIEAPFPNDLLDFLERLPQDPETLGTPSKVRAVPPHCLTNIQPECYPECSYRSGASAMQLASEGVLLGDKATLKKSRTTKQRRAAATRSFLHVLQKLVAGPEILSPQYCTVEPIHWALSLGYGEGGTFAWAQLPAAVDPARGGCVPQDRSARKQQQLENLVAVAGALLSGSKPLRVVDFCSGSGHVGLLLATLYQQHSYMLVDMSAHALMSASERMADGGIEARTIRMKVEEFNEPFDVAVALHACGEASDLTMHLAVSQRAAFIIVPCCVGKVRHACKDLRREGALNLSYPRSEAFRSFLDELEYLQIVRAADYTHGVEGCTGNEHISTERRQCKSFVERDRLLFAHESGYLTMLVQMTPPSCTPKNDILVGVPANWHGWP